MSVEPSGAGRWAAGGRDAGIWALGNRVVPRRPERTAPHESADGEPDAPPGAVDFEGLTGVFRATRCETTWRGSTLTASLIEGNTFQQDPLNAARLLVAVHWVEHVTILPIGSQVPANGSRCPELHVGERRMSSPGQAQPSRTDTNQGRGRRCEESPAIGDEPGFAPQPDPRFDQWRRPHGQIPRMNRRALRTTPALNEHVFPLDGAE